ncbi:MAG: hypothetical protein KDK99_02875 [Verrucomicrobiales bacterium]|nr:hypothetical protein [Verrucomicrobiales bacterium]
MIIRSLAALLAVSSLSLSSYAGVTTSPTSSKATLETAVTQDDGKSTLDRIWDAATLYKSDSGILNQFALTGRIHLQYAHGYSDHGDFTSGFRPDDVTWGDIEVRRWRVGFKSKWFDNRLTLEGQINITPDLDPFYENIYDLRMIYNLTDHTKVTFGKTKSDIFSHEFYQSSKEILTVERSLLVNTLTSGQLTGAVFDGTVGNWVWALAGFAGDFQPEFSKFDAGALIQARIGYDFAKATGYDEAGIYFDYQASTSAENVISKFPHAFSLHGNLAKGRASIFADVLGGLGRNGQGDVWGITVAPAYFIIEDKLQAVLRYQFAHGDNDGLRLQSRYERLAPTLIDGGRGTTYNAVYGGLNWLIYGHKLKLMTGVEYHHMEGGSDGSFDDWTWSAAFRMFF